MSNKAYLALAGLTALAGVATVIYRMNSSASDKLPARVVVTESPDAALHPYFRKYDVNAFVTNETIVTSDYLRDGTLRHTDRDTPESKGTTNLLMALMAINGVKNVTFYPYQVVVTIGAAFDWSYVEPQILETFRKAFGWGDSPLDIERRQEHYGSSHFMH